MRTAYLCQGCKFVRPHHMVFNDEMRRACGRCGDTGFAFCLSPNSLNGLEQIIGRMTNKWCDALQSFSWYWIKPFPPIVLHQGALQVFRVF